jgi:hypothetical protein
VNLVKNLALVAVAGVGLIGAPAVFAQACSVAAWTGPAPVAGAVAGRPTDATPTSRYAGTCAFRSPAVGGFVTDPTPAAEQAFRARFYVYTGLTGGQAVVYRALNASAAQMIGVTYDAAGSQFTFNTSGGSANVGSVVANRWYAIELSWTKAAIVGPPAQAANTMVVQVQGAGSATPLTAAGGLVVTGVAAGDQIDDAQLGWVANGGTAGVGSITTDAYESRRQTAIGRLCRGDANVDGILNVQDRIIITNEVIAVGLANGHPDATEDGIVNVQDRIVLTNRVLAADVCP